MNIWNWKNPVIVFLKDDGEDVAICELTGDSFDRRPGAELRSQK